MGQNIGRGRNYWRPPEKPFLCFVHGEILSAQWLHSKVISTNIWHNKEGSNICYESNSKGRTTGQIFLHTVADMNAARDGAQFKAFAELMQTGWWAQKFSNGDHMQWRIIYLLNKKKYHIKILHFPIKLWQWFDCRGSNSLFLTIFETYNDSDRLLKKHDSLSN